MRYSPEHKARTRERILRQARKLFRKHGYDGVGIDHIMESAGLTRGGFYGYFRSKSHLFAESLEQGHDFVERMQARGGEHRDVLLEQALEVVAGYLAPENRRRVGQGCALAALAGDAARADRATQAAFGRAVHALAAEFERSLAGERAVDAIDAGNDPRALASIALCVGGLMLSRAVAQRDLADSISAACRAAVERELRT